MVWLETFRMDSLKSLILLWDHLAAGFNVPAIDRKTVKRRALNEGIRFLTVTLPSIGKYVEDYIIHGVVNYEMLNSIQCKRYRDKPYPVLLHTLLRRVVDVPLDEIYPPDIKVIRQLTCLFYKLEVPFDDEVITHHTRCFTTRDSNLSKDYTDLSEKEVILCRRAKAYIHRALSTPNGVIDPTDIVPKHGSGATACRTRNMFKYHSYRFIPRLDTVYNYCDYMYYNYIHLSERLDEYKELIECAEPHARMVFVPKDSRGPRTICCEPREFQFIQQGLMNKIYHHIDNTSIAKGYINFVDQTVNQALVRESSKTGELATLDLSEASDRVSWELVKTLFPQNWVIHMDACRSRYVDLPDGSTYGPLRKFSAMGSALCFPIEALVFWGLLKAALPSDCNVWVYGDDIILPTQYVAIAIDTLERFELKVNTSKSCYKTPFRESCGADYFDGCDVGYVKFRHLIRTTSHRDMSSWFECISFINEVINVWGLTQGLNMLSCIEDLFNKRAPFSCVHTHEGVVTHPDLNLSRNYYFYKRRYNENLQLYELKIPHTSIREYVPPHVRTNHRNEMFRNHVTRQQEDRPVGSYSTEKRTTRWSYVCLD